MTKLHPRTTLTRVTSIALAVALSLVLLPSVSAQEDRHPPRDRDGRQPPSAEEREKMMNDRLSRMQDHLQLSDEQVTSLRPILTEQGRQMHTIRQEHRGEREETRTSMQELHKSTNAKIAKVLTEDQFQQFTKQQQRHREQRGEGRGPQGEGHGPRGDGEGRGHGGGGEGRGHGGDQDGGHRGPPPRD